MERHSRHRAPSLPARLAIIPKDEREGTMGLFKKRGKWNIDYYYQGRRIRECIGTSKRLAERALDARKGFVQG